MLLKKINYLFYRLRLEKYHSKNITCQFGIDFKQCTNVFKLKLNYITDLCNLFSVTKHNWVKDKIYVPLNSNRIHIFLIY